MVLFEGAADHRQGLPEAFFEDFRGSAGPAALVGAFAARQGCSGRCHEGRDRLEKTIGAQAMAGAVRRTALDAVLPALMGAIDDGGGLVIGHGPGSPLGGDDLLEIHAVRDQNGVPVVQQGELDRVPLDVFARGVSIPANPVGIDGGLIPVDMQDRVLEAGRPGGGHGFADPAGRHPALPFDDMNARRIAAVIIHRAEGQAERCRNPDPRRSGGQPQKRGGRGRMPV